MFGKKKERSAKSPTSKAKNVRKGSGRVEASSEVEGCSTRACGGNCSRTSSSRGSSSKKSK